MKGIPTGPELAHPTSTSPITYPGLHKAASDKTAAGKRSYRSAIALGLGISLATAFFLDLVKLDPTGGFPSWGSIVSAISGTLLAVALLLQITRRRGDRDRRWFLGRAIAESAKTTSWKYMMRLAPFEDDNNADVQFRSVLSQVLAATRAQGNVAEYHDRDLEVTDEMRRVRASRLDERRAVYVARRLDDQVRWYSGKSSISAKASKRYFIVAVVVQGAAIVWLLLRAAGLELFEFSATLTTAAASLIAWSEAQRHDELAISYGVAAEELRQIRAHSAEQLIEADLTRLVLDAESAISREHTTWIAKTPAVARMPIDQPTAIRGVPRRSDPSGPSDSSG
jgi:hypothetical protein